MLRLVVQVTVSLSEQNVPNKYTEQHTHISSSMFVHKSLLKIAQFNQSEQQRIHHISPITLLTLVTNINTRSATGQETFDFFVEHTTIKLYLLQSATNLNF